MSVLMLLATFLLLLLLTVGAKKSLLFSSAAALLFAVALAGLIYGLSAGMLGSVVMHGVFTAIEISLLIFGALLFFHLLQARGFQQQLQQAIQPFSNNYFVIVLLLAMFFGSFIEGVSGFGTPAMIVAPLLLALRFPPLLAGGLPLLANTIPVLFGAVGTPVKIGFAGLDTDNIPAYAVLLVALPLFMLPFLFAKMLSRHQIGLQAEDKKKNYVTGLVASAAFLLPFLLASFTGPEFPTIIAATAGLVLWLLLLKAIKPSATVISLYTLRPFLHTFRPYLAMALLLLAAKLLAGTKGIFIVLSDFSFQRKVSFFQPGLLFIIGTIVLYFSAKERRPGMLRELVASTALKLPVVFGTIACLAVLARLLSQFLSVSDVLPASGATHPFLLYTLALATGFAGSFMAGSATVSNLLFGTQWYQAGLQMQLPVSLLLACQLAGAAMGNALSIQNIAMVQAVLHQEKMDAQLLKILWKPVVLLLMGIVLATWLVSLCVV